MNSEVAPIDDSELRQRILTGVAAVAELETRFRQPLERFLVGLCDRSDGRSQEKSVEIAGQILAECFIKKPSLLERWQGPDNLEAFLRTAAKNRLKSWWSSADKKRTEVNSESLSIANASSAGNDADQEELAIAQHALRAGVEAASVKCPEGLVFMRLKGLHGVDQRAISTCWGHHEAQTSRRIKDAMTIIRTTALELAATKGCELSMEVLQQALQQDAKILLGGDGAADTDGDHTLLKALAEGAADEAIKRKAVEMMCLNPRSLGFFARMLNRENAAEALVVKDPALAGMSARLTECVRSSLDMLHPAEAAGLVTPLMSGSLADLLDHLKADGGTLWLLRPGEAALEAVFNPKEPEITGMRQPLVSGIISLVLATGEPACVSGVAAHQRHSPAIDIALGKATQAMIAVPFVLAGTVRGVLTAVRFKSVGQFEAAGIDVLARHSEILAELMIRNLTARILG
jgi:DNA-directed RNA polymerase specialized sigma24 family protein